MTSRVTPDLPDALVGALGQGCPALLLTQGADGFPATAFTWAAARSRGAVRFGADLGSTTLTNLEREGRASLQVIAEPNLVYLVKGETALLRPRMEAAPFKVALMELTVQEVKDQSWPGVTLRPLGYAWAPEQEAAMLAMEAAVYAELREWNP